MKKYVTIISVLSLIFVPMTLRAEKHIEIDKSSLMLHVVENGDTIESYPVCVGSNPGQKRVEGDRKTPEGTFPICQIQDASKWTHDFKDGAGARKGAYGPWFFRLRTPVNNSIGIHGTCFPESVGRRESEGCVRLRNDDLRKLRRHVYIGMKVNISADKVE